MRQGLIILVVGGDPERFRAALSLATSAAALDRPVRLFLQAEAVPLLRSPIAALSDQDHASAGLPTLGELLDAAMDMGVPVTACQSGLALAGLRAGQLPQGISFGGLIGVLQAEPDAQVVPF